MKKSSLPSEALKRRARGLSASERNGLAAQLAGTDGAAAAHLAALWQAWRTLLDRGEAIEEASLWKAWQSDASFDLPTYKSAIQAFERALDDFLKPVSELPISLQLSQMEEAEIQAFEAHLLGPDSSQKTDALRLLLALLSLLRPGGDALRLDLWEAWRPGEAFDAKVLRNGLTTLQNLLGGFLARMDQTKLYKWLCILSTRERTELDKFLRVQGDARRQESIRLLELLSVQIQQKRPLPRREFFAAWRGTDEPFSESILNAACNSLLELVRKFFASKRQWSNPADEIVAMVRWMDERDCHALLEQELPAAQKRLLELPQDAETFRRAAILEEVAISLRNATGRNIRQPVDFAECLYWGDQDHLLNAFRRYAAAITSDRSLGTQHDLGGLPARIAAAQNASRPLQGLVQAYLWVVLLLTAPDPAPHFILLMDWLLQTTPRPRLVPDLERELLKYAINHCASHLRAGLLEHEETLARLYVHGIDTGLLQRHDVIDAAELQNMLTIFCRTGRLAHAQATFAAHRHRLASGTDAVVVGFLEALLDFWAGDYAAARPKFEDAFGAGDIYLKVESRLYVLEIRWLAKEFLPEGPAMQTPFESEYNRLRAFRTRLDATDQLSASVDQHAYYLLEFYKLANKDAKPAKKCAGWRQLQAELLAERKARHLSWLRAQCQKAITDLNCS
jgi:hypothetical protein